MTDTQRVYEMEALLDCFKDTNIKSVEYDLERLTWTIHYKNSNSVTDIEAKDFVDAIFGI